MDSKQAMDIMSSENLYEVFYQNQSVWVNNVDPKTGLAQVVDENQQNLEVPIQELISRDLLQ